MLLLAYFLGEISTALTLLYLKMHDFFFLISKYLSMLFIVFLLGKISPPKHSVFTNLGLYLSILKIFIFQFSKYLFSLGEISPELYSLVQISPDLSPLCSQIYDYFFSFSDIHMCYSQPFHWGKFPPLKLSIFTILQLFLSIFKVSIMCHF